jgi:hypothetical protein
LRRPPQQVRQLLATHLPRRWRLSRATLKRQHFAWHFSTL